MVFQFFGRCVEVEIHEGGAGFDLLQQFRPVALADPVLLEAVEAIVLNGFIEIGFFGNFDLQLGEAFPYFQEGFLHNFFGQLAPPYHIEGESTERIIVDLE